VLPFKTSNLDPNMGVRLDASPPHRDYLGPGPDHCDHDCMKKRKEQCRVYTSAGSQYTDKTKWSGNRKAGRVYGFLKDDERENGIQDLTSGLPTQPLGFLSKLGAEGNGGAHILMIWKGKALDTQAWSPADVSSVDLSKQPRYRNNLAMTSYPFTKLFAHKDRIFTLQVKPALDETSDKEDEKLAVDLSEARQCNGKLTVVKLAQIQWPRDVKRRMDFLCQPYQNEEATLTTSSPAILHNPSYGSDLLLLNVKNRVHSYDLSDILKTPTCKPALQQIAYPGPLYKGVVASLVGRSLRDFEASQATTMVTVQDEMAYILSSYSTIQTIDLSLWVPCSRILDFLRTPFNDWKVQPGFSKKAETTLNLKRAKGSGSSSDWQCSATKQVNTLKGDSSVALTKNTACCALLSDGKLTSMPCCVEKDADVPEGASAALAERIANALGAM